MLVIVGNGTFYPYYGRPDFCPAADWNPKHGIRTWEEVWRHSAPCWEKCEERDCPYKQANPAYSWGIW